ncbi:helix-turn-helix transcriptional regulator [Salegentibacter salegens]|uniref:AraC-type DNA-binding protein n=1 Tax=Salegentibacter salegens TaxID=143223 RepID=A0A1M7LW70_9FLAO|nr:AraC family transcriptional regulator [Salegentibacter salegens]PRX52143.1 AraC-like DNA-binding protein [Salegentibacter salegens]SHM82488.1 AraC-type DNA-binding protein [Salegentibacter salegens]
MYIESKLVEVNETLFSQDLSEEIDPNIIKEEIGIPSCSWLKAKSKIQFKKGLFIVESFFENEKNLTDIFSIRGEYIQISYLGKGDSHLVSLKDKKPIEMGRINCCYHCDTVTTIEMPANKPTHYQAIYLSKEYYLELLKNEAWVENNSFYKHIIQGDFQKWGTCKFPIDYNLYHILNEITKSDWNNDFKKYYLDLRLKELFLSLHFCQEEVCNGVIKGISKENLEKIRTAHAYLIENFKNPPTIKVLARKILLNELQLKKDFKKMYGKTIRSFIIELRMEKAKTLLGKHTVSEMAGILGYKSVPHFINTFKKCYGYTPKQGLNQ